MNGSRWWLHIYKFSYLHFIVLYIYMAPCSFHSSAMTLVIISFYSLEKKNADMEIFIRPWVCMSTHGRFAFWKKWHIFGHSLPFLIHNSNQLQGNGLRVGGEMTSMWVNFFNVPHYTRSCYAFLVQSPFSYLEESFMKWIFNVNWYIACMLLMSIHNLFLFKSFLLDEWNERTQANWLYLSWTFNLSPFLNECLVNKEAQLKWEMLVKN